MAPPSRSARARWRRWPSRCRRSRCTTAPAAARPSPSACRASSPTRWAAPWAAFWYHFAIMFEAVFILTVLDSGTRVIRFVVQELFDDVAAMRGPVALRRTPDPVWFTSALAVVGWGLILSWGIVDREGGTRALIRMFGTANQLLAVIALTLATVVMLKRHRRHAWVTGVPMAIVSTVVVLTATFLTIFASDPRVGALASARAAATARATQNAFLSAGLTGSWGCSSSPFSPRRRARSSHAARERPLTPRAERGAEMRSVILSALGRVRRAKDLVLDLSEASSRFPANRTPQGADVAARRRGALLAAPSLLLMETASDRVTRQSGTSFYYAFRILPAEKRRAIYALYSFCRVVDDCVDEPGGGGEAGLVRWLEEVWRCYAGQPETELGPRAGRGRFPVPDPPVLLRGHRGRLPDGPHRPRATRPSTSCATYCERVASAVGLASIEIFGYEDPGTRDYAVELGLALQLTNILRDVAGDAARGRVYLPLEDLARFGVSEEARFEAARNGRRLARPAASTSLLAFEAERARAHYDAAPRALPAEDRRSMLSAEIMGAVYRACSRRWRAAGTRWAGPSCSCRGRARPGHRPAHGPARVLGPVKVVVLGGGFAGLAAAIALQEQRHDVTLLERRGRPGRARHLLPRRPLRRRRRQRHAPHGRRLPALPSTSSAAPGRRTSLLVQDDLRIDYVDDAGPTVPALPPRFRRRCTCWPGSSACACRGGAVPGAAARPGRALRRAARRPHPRRVLPAARARRPRRGASSGTRWPSPSSTRRRSARRPSLFWNVYRRRSSRAAGPRASCSSAAAGATAARAAGRATSRRGEGCCAGAPLSRPSRSTAHE